MGIDGGITQLWSIIRLDLPRTHILALFFFSFSFPQAPHDGLIIDPFEGWIYQGGKQHRRVEESLGGLLDDHSTCFQDPHAAPPWSWHVK